MEVWMSAFKTQYEKLLDRILPDWLFPERHWEALDDQRYARVFDSLLSEDPLKGEMLGYLKKRKPRLGFFKQDRSGGGWTVRGNITLAKDADPLTPYALSLIVHETHHLQQSILTRLSMQGELSAWQCQARNYPVIAQPKGNRIGSRGQAYGEGKETCDLWDELLHLSTGSREDLEKAQKIMVDIAPAYRSHALPLYPLHKEIWFHLKRGRFKEAWQLIPKLLNAAGS
jgi:hypothetical protein